jgi:hypothetical protein
MLLGMTVPSGGRDEKAPERRLRRGAETGNRSGEAGTSAGDGTEQVREAGVPDARARSRDVHEDGVYEGGVCEGGVCEDGVCEDGVCEDGVCEDGVCEDGDAVGAGTDPAHGCPPEQVRRAAELEGRSYRHVQREKQKAAEARDRAAEAHYRSARLHDRQADLGWGSVEEHREQAHEHREEAAADSDGTDRLPG